MSNSTTRPCVWGKLNPFEDPLPLLALHATTTCPFPRSTPPVTAKFGKSRSLVSQSLPSGPVELWVPFGHVATLTVNEEYVLPLSGMVNTSSVELSGWPTHTACDAVCCTRWAPHADVALAGSV